MTKAGVDLFPDEGRDIQSSNAARQVLTFPAPRSWSAGFLTYVSDTPSVYIETKAAFPAALQMSPLSL